MVKEISPIVKNERGSFAPSLLNMLRIWVGVWIMSYYLLPNTVWGRISPAFQWVHLSDSIFHRFGFAVTILFAVGSLSLLCWLTRRFPESQRFGSRALIVLVAVYLLPMMATLCFYYDHPDLSHDINLILGAISTGLFCAYFLGTPHRVAVALTIVCTFQGMYALYYQKHGINTFLSGDVLRAGGTFNHPSAVYVLMMLVLPLTIVLALREERSISKLLLMMASSIMFAVLVLTWYRAGFLGLSMALVWLSFRVFKARLITFAIAFCLAGTFLFVFLHRTTGAVNSASSERSISGHLLLWKDGFAVFKRYWLTGVGVGTLEIFETTPTRDPKMPTHSLHNEPQNIALYWLDEMGIGGGILLILFAVAIARIIESHKGNPIALSLGASWIALVGAGIFDTPFGTAARYSGNVLVASLLGATILLPQMASSQRNGTEHEVAS